MRQYKLRIDLPFLKKGKIYIFDDETGEVFAEHKNIKSDYPLRTGLAGYLWLLLTERKYMRRMKWMN